MDFKPIYMYIVSIHVLCSVSNVTVPNIHAYVYSFPSASKYSVEVMLIQADLISVKFSFGGSLYFIITQVVISYLKVS